MPCWAHFQMLLLCDIDWGVVRKHRTPVARLLSIMSWQVRIRNSCRITILHIIDGMILYLWANSKNNISMVINYWSYFCSDPRPSCIKKIKSDWNKIWLTLANKALSMNLILLKLLNGVLMWSFLFVESSFQSQML